MRIPLPLQSQPLPQGAVPLQLRPIGRLVPVALPAVSAAPMAPASPVARPSAEAQLQPVPQVQLGQPPALAPLMDSESDIVMAAIKQGNDREDLLTDLVFFSRYPARQGKRLHPQEKRLIQEWQDIRARLVQPILRARTLFQTAADRFEAGDCPTAAILFERVSYMAEITDEVRAFCWLNIAQVHLQLKHFVTAIVYLERFLATPFSDQEGTRRLIEKAKEQAGMPAAKEIAAVKRSGIASQQGRRN
jgi:hypothetical protein